MTNIQASLGMLGKRGEEQVLYHLLSGLIKIPEGSKGLPLSKFIVHLPLYLFTDLTAL